MEFVWKHHGISMEYGMESVPNLHGYVWNNCGISMEDRGRKIVELNDGVFWILLKMFYTRQRAARFCSVCHW